MSAVRNAAVNNELHHWLRGLIGICTDQIAAHNDEINCLEARIDEAKHRLNVATNKLLVLQDMAVMEGFADLTPQA